MTKRKIDLASRKVDHERRVEPRAVGAAGMELLIRRFPLTRPVIARWVGTHT